MADPTPATAAPLLVPVQIDAFRLNEACVGSGDAKNDVGARIAPITQPNYTFLRLDNFVIQNDVLGHTDLHDSAPVDINSRLRDLGQLPSAPRRHRHGIYLHWTLPRFYRSSASVSDQDAKPDNNNTTTSSNDPTPNNNSTPGFVQPPTRWLVIRKLDLDTVVPAEAKSQFPEYAAWVLESDYLWSLDQIPLDYDLQVDVSPFVKSIENEDGIAQQAEVFIGRKTPLESWKEDPQKDPLDISLLRSSNQLFADFQLHNSNVFSMLDNFRYGDDTAPQYLESAKASYYLFGWHRDSSVDPLWDGSAKEKHQDRLAKLFMKFPGDAPTATQQTWLDAPDSVQLLCHGAMYDVVWDDVHKPGSVPADDFATRLRNQNVPAISVGISPIDALITYITARKRSGKDTDAPPIQLLEEDILAIESLLHARDDGVESQREAKDTVYNWSFSRSGGGVRYFLSGGEDQTKEGKPTDPDPAAKEAIVDVNRYQLVHDACSRVLEQHRWDMFSLWWKYVSNPLNANDDSEKRDAQYKDMTKDLSGRITALEDIIKSLKTSLDSKLHPPVPTLPVPPISPNLPAPPVSTSPALPSPLPPPVNPLQEAKSGTLPFFYRGQDPTVLIGGIDSGWPLDYLENVNVRLPNDTVTSTDGMPVALQTLVDDMFPSPPLPGKVFTVFKAAVAALAHEFWALRPEGNITTAPPGTIFPQFHDQLTAQPPPMPEPSPAGISTTTTSATPSVSSSPEARWRDRWSDRQPWFPLFVEWEAEYTHIPTKYWKLAPQAARLSDSKRVRYGIDVPDGKALFDVLTKRDSYTVSGRVLILPQPSFSLEAKVRQLFSNTPPTILDEKLKSKEREYLLKNIASLSFLSAPLAGFADNLTTLAQGTHIKPENKILNEQGLPELSAVPGANFDKAGLSVSRIKQIQGSSALTPFASVTAFSSPDDCPFKPVTHGQFRFRKFNIIDKFGQTLTVNDPQPYKDNPPAVYPAISDWYEPQLFTANTANTVVQGHDDGTCEFLQMPPSINQNARLNSSFVMSTANDPPLPSPSPPRARWRSAQEWENPIWGWLVVNYADYGIQLFLPDGTFYREVRIGGPTGAVQGQKWTPFAPDSALSGANTKQLDALIAQLNSASYLNQFWGMINKALDALPPAPTTYAGFLNAIVGKPLALANAGWSLELDRQAYSNQSSNSVVEFPKETLLPKDPEEPFDPKDNSYKFQIKLGDQERAQDGLVGYFDLETSTETELDLSKLYTYFLPPSAAQPLEAITPQNYPVFKPFFVQPFKSPLKPGDAIEMLDPALYANARDRAMETSGRVVGVIIDPFTAVHAFSSLLPANELKLPSWTWQSAMNTMTAFFHAGPFHATADVPSFVEGNRLTTAKMKDTPKDVVPIPALPAGDWNWLQPYPDPKASADDQPPAYNAFSLDRRGDLAKPGFQSGPYTALEGYLQLRNPIMRDPPPKPPAAA